MKTKILLLCVIIFITSQYSFAQLDSFDLSKYKVADYKRHSLDFNFNSSTYTNVDIAKYKDSKEHDRSDRFSSNLNINYNYRLNTRKKQEYLNISTSVAPYNFYNLKDGGNSYYYTKEKQTNSNIQFNFDYSNSFYQPNNVFFKIGAYSSNGGFISKDSYESNTNDTYVDNTNEQSSVNSNNFLNLAIGKGRIENVEDARMALYILEDLIKTKSLTRKPTEEEILEFASIITQLKNKRFFDYRIRKIYEIQSLDTFLNRTGLINKTDAIYFTTLNDNWSYSNNPIRGSGYQLSLNLNPNFRYHESRYSNNSPELNANKTAGLDISGEYIYNKPLNLQWQLKKNLAIGYRKEKYWSNYYYYDDFLNDILYFNASLTVGYYPNSRSYISLSFANNLSKIWTDNEHFTQADLNYYLNMEIEAYYYFSDRLSANLRSNLYLYYNEYPNYYYLENTLSVNPIVQLSLNYALF